MTQTSYKFLTLFTILKLIHFVLMLPPLLSLFILLDSHFLYTIVTLLYWLYTRIYSVHYRVWNGNCEFHNDYDVLVALQSLRNKCELSCRSRHAETSRSQIFMNFEIFAFWSQQLKSHSFQCCTDSLIWIFENNLQQAKKVYRL